MDLWSTPVSNVYDRSDLPALERLFLLRDSVARTGDTDYKALGEIRQLEDRFGLTPLARMRLGVSVGQAHKTLADLNQTVAPVEEIDDEILPGLPDDSAV